MIMRKTDIIIAAGAVIAAAVLYLAFGAAGAGKDGAAAVVYIDGKEYARLPLDKDAEMEIEGYGGVNHLEIRAGKADITSADCPDKYCVNQKPAALTGESLVCLPNRVVVEIEGAEDADIDGVSY